MPELEKIDTYGPVIIETPTNLCLKKLSLDLGSETDAIIFNSTNDFTLDISGNGHLLLSGVIDTLNMQCAGNCEIMCDLRVKKMILKQSENTELTIHGDIFRMSADIREFGYFDAINCQIGHCNLKTSGKADARLNCLDAIELTAKNQSSIHFRKAGLVNIKDYDPKATVKNEARITKIARK